MLIYEIKSQILLCWEVMDQQSEMSVFVQVVEYESFSATARVLKLTPSAVSKLIGRLENRLGAQLLNRTTRHLSLTEEGRAFYQRCMPILSAIDEAEMAVTELHAKPRGLLKVNATNAFGQFHIQPLIPKFLEQHPDLRIQLTLSDSLVNLVEEEVDVAIRIADMPDSTLIAKKITSVQRAVAAAPSYIKKFGVPKSPEDLKNHNCLTLSFETSLNQWEFKGANTPQRIRVKGNFETNNATALYKAGLAGLGLFRATNFVVGRDFKEGTLIPVLKDFEMTNQVNIYAVYPHSKHLSPKVRAFVDLMTDAFMPVPPWEL